MSLIKKDSLLFDDRALSAEESADLLRRIEAGERIPFSERMREVARPFAEMAVTTGVDLDDEPTVELPAR